MTQAPYALGTRVRDEIDLAGMNQKQLAKAMGCSQKHLSNVLTGKAPLTESFASLIAEATGLDAGELLALAANRRKQ